MRGSAVALNIITNPIPLKELIRFSDCDVPSAHYHITPVLIFTITAFNLV